MPSKVSFLKLFRKATSSKEALFQKSYFLEQKFVQKSDSKQHLLFQESYFSEGLSSQKSYFFATLFFRRGIFSTVALPIYQLVIKRIRHQLRMWELSFIDPLCSESHSLFDSFWLHSFSIISLWLQKLLWNSSVLSKLIFQSLYFSARTKFSRNTISEQPFFHV